MTVTRRIWDASTEYIEAVQAEIHKFRLLAAATTDSGAQYRWSDYRVAWEKAALLYGSDDLYGPVFVNPGSLDL